MDGLPGVQIAKIVEQFSRIFLKFQILDKNPVTLENNVKLFSSEAHVIEAVGKNYGNTVTSLCRYFGITKSAASQVVSRVVRKGCIERSGRPDNAKEIILSLTPAGWQAFYYHESLNAAFAKEIALIRAKYTDEEADVFMRILNDVEMLFERSIK
jgi:DNA-binding MarR family transcriptional regulator